MKNAKIKTNIELIRTKNLITYIEPRYKTMTQFAEEIGKAYSQIHSMLFDSSKSFGDKIARDIETRLGLSLGYLDIPEPEKLPLDVVMLPLYAPKLYINKDNDILNETKIGEMPFSLTEIQKANVKVNNLISFMVESDSMQYTINDGSMAIVDLRQKEIIDNKIYAFTVGNQGVITVKRLRIGVDGIIIQSDNKEFAEEKVHYDSKVKLVIIGRVLWVNNKLL